MKYCKVCRRFFHIDKDFCPFCGSGEPVDLKIYPDETDALSGVGISGVKISFKSKDYIVTKVIGLGGYGLILEVQAEDNSGPYALKVPATLEKFFNPGKDFSQREIEDAERSIESEASVLKKIRSERIIKVYDTGKALCCSNGRQKEFPVILMELAICTLREIVLLEAAGKIEISPAEKLKMTSCIVNTMEELHNSGIIHRDIALENIFAVSRNMSVEYVLADFGTSREKRRKNDEKTNRCRWQGQVS